MADAKITALTELTAVDPSDLLAVVDDPSGSPATKKATISNVADAIAGDSTVPIMNHSMARQAIMNGNFDVWQRGTTATNPSTGIYPAADRWKYSYTLDGGTLPTIILAQGTFTSGGLYKSQYYLNINTNGAGSGFGANALHHMAYQFIENGTRLLCGDGKTVTLSFYAASSVANKKIGVYLVQSYGAGGSPSSEEIINGTNWTLTGSWTKYTHTFTTNTLSGKTFGTDGTANLIVRFSTMWGTTTDAYVGASGAETFVGSGDTGIAQIQLCAGDVALPFQPKSFAQEYQECKRYYQKSYAYATAPGTATTADTILNQVGWDTTSGSARMRVKHKFEVEMRTNPVFAFYDEAGNASKITTYALDTVTSNQAVYSIAATAKSISVTHTAATGYSFHFTASADT